MSKKIIYHYMYNDGGAASEETSSSGSGVGYGSISDLREELEKLQNGVLRLFSPMNEGTPVAMNASQIDGIRANYDFYSVGGVSALSDVRHKEVLSNVTLSVEDIAQMQAIKFKWKDRKDEKVHAGAIAQEWKEKLPEVVSETADGTLTLDYGAAALICAIKCAEEIVELKRTLCVLLNN